MGTRLDEFRAYRARMNERILGAGHLGIKRFFNLDSKGSIVIPHLRHAFETIDLLRQERRDKEQETKEAVR